MCAFLFAQSDNCGDSLYIEPAASVETLCELHDDFDTEFEIGQGTIYPKASDLGAVNEIIIDVKIVGDFIVDENFKFTGVRIKVDPDVKIWVKLPYTTGGEDTGFENTLGKRVKLEIDDCDIFACDSLWQGIVMDGKTDLVIENGTQIEDAEAAVSAVNTDGVTLDITNSTFNRNVIGIEIVANPSTNTYDPVFRDFYNNDFTCTSFLNETINQYYSYAGVVGENVLLNLRHAILEQSNVFQNLNYGVIIDGKYGRLQCFRDQFDECWEAGIYIKKGAKIEIERCIFFNIFKRGIFGEAVSDMDVKNSAFYFVDPGYEYQPDCEGIGLYAFPYGGEINIYGSCDFVTSDEITDKVIRAVRIKTNEIHSKLDVSISNCDFDLSGSEMSGVYIDGNSARNAEVTVENCDFDLNYIYDDEVIDERVHGVYILNGDKYFTKVIGCDFTGNGLPYGIRFRGSQGFENEISGNTVYGGYYSLFRDLWMHDVTNLKVCDNTDNHSANVAFSVWYQCMNTDFIANMIYGCARSVQLATTGTFWGKQEHKGNQFIPVSFSLGGGFTLWFFPFPECVDHSNGFFNRFIVHTPRSEFDNGWVYLSYYHPYLYEPEEFFDVDENGSPASGCQTQSPPTVADSIDLFIALDEMDNLWLSGADQWRASQYLYARLMEDDDYASLDNAFDQFLSNHENGVIGKLYKANAFIQKAVYQDSAFLDSLVFYRGMIDTVDLEIDSIAGIASWSSTDRTNLNDKMEVKVAYFDTLTTLLNAMASRESDLLDSAATVLGTISTSAVYQRYFKDVMTSWIDVLDNGFSGFSTAELDTLSVIAQQCVTNAGMAAYWARGLLNDCLLADIQDAIDTCLAEPDSFALDSFIVSGSPPMLESPGGSGPEFDVYPNPVLDKFVVQSEGAIKITDVYGFDPAGKNVLAVEGVNKSKITLQFPKETNVLFLRIFFDDGTTGTRKLLFRD